ncbi:MAG: type I secretion system permease/ATPase, partial [Cypionkella sp.]
QPGLAAAAGVSAVISLLMLTGSVYMLQVYDRVLASGSVPTLVGLFAIVVVLYSFLGLYDFLRARILSRLAMRLEASLGLVAFKGWLQAGQGNAQPLRDLETLRSFVAGPTMPGLFDLPWAPLYLGVLFLVHPWLGWLTIGAAVTVGGLAWLSHQLSHKRITQSMSDEVTARDFAERSRRGAEMILSMGMQGAVASHWRRLQMTMLAANQKAGDPAELLGAISRAFRMLMQSAILTLGAYLVIKGEMSGGMIIASSILTGRALAPVDQIIGQWRGIGRALEAHHRLTRFFANLAPETSAIELPAPTGQITVTNLGKMAPAQGLAEQRKLLDGISFALEPGDAMGVIGASASGKSTLARLLAGAIAPDIGEIRLDGATRAQWDGPKLGRHIGYLPQQIELLPGTLRDNIARFDPELDDCDVIAAAQTVGIHEMILKLPDGYGTRVGAPDATPLSGGQLQRLGLARALCGKPVLIVLDEPNSNLDSAGETWLTQCIHELRAAGSVVIVMAHRPNVLEATNKLLVLESGRMLSFGTSAETLREQPLPLVAAVMTRAQTAVLSLVSSAAEPELSTEIQPVRPSLDTAPQPYLIRTRPPGAAFRKTSSKAVPLFKSHGAVS